LPANPSTWIVVVNYNGLADTRRCLRSLVSLQNARCQVVVVDNASTACPISELQRDFAWCHLIATPINGGWAGGNNVGIRYALAHRADYVLLLNNDTVAAPQLVARLVASATDHPDYGIIGPVIRSLEPPCDVMTDGCAFNDGQQAGFFRRIPVPLCVPGTAGLTEVDIVNGCCMMVAARVFEKVGLIDERFFLIHEESDFCLRARQAGFCCGILGEALVWHKGSSTFKSTGKAAQRYFDARNLLLLLRKHRTYSPGRRGPARSICEYVRYVYYRYCIEREQEHMTAADAVLEGLSDAVIGRYGARRHACGLGPALLQSIFEPYRRFRILSFNIQNRLAHANPVS